MAFALAGSRKKELVVKVCTSPREIGYTQSKWWKKARKLSWEPD